MAPLPAYLTVLLTLGCLWCCMSAVHGINYTMEEQAAIGSYIGNVSADSGLKDIVGENDFANLRYSILSGGSQNSALFKIAPSTGVLTVGAWIDREALCPYAETCDLTLEIAAQYESLLRKFNVKIVIEDINDNPPRFPQSSLPPFQLSEATSVDFPLSLDAATDLDGTRNFSVQSYSLEPDGVPFRVQHTVNAVGVVQLSLVVSRQLDREVRSSYSLKVWAYDGGSPPKSGSVALTVNVLDVNDNAPKFSKDVYTHNISESTPPGTAILTISASDADEGDNAVVVYSISSQQPVKDQDKFSMGNTTGVLSVAQWLTAGLHRVLVEAQDQGSPPKPPTQALVEVTVLDTDNSPPVLKFDLLSVSDLEPGLVPESAKVSTAVGYLAVSDPDSGLNALVTCSSDNDHLELKALNLDEYKVIISQSLDRETQSHFTVALVCSDAGSPPLTSSVTFEVEVTDVNDNQPVFLERNYSTSVAENNGSQDGLLPVAATDADAGPNGNVTYSLSGDRGLFQIGATNGMIKARIQFDYENTTRYVFHVLATDQGQPAFTATATVTVNVLDINDEPPRFSAPSYVMRVSEGARAGVLVGNVSAKDRDTGAGGQVVLSIVPQPGLALPFQLSPVDGAITTTAAILDRETRGHYTFHVLARDRGMQPLSSSALVTVEILDLNDNAPIFVFTDMNVNATARIFIPVDAQFVVANVRAIDADAGPNGAVTYSVVGGNASHFFRVERNTGAVVTLRDLHQPELGWYSLLVRASDQGSPSSLHTDHNFTLQVLPQSASQGGGGGGGAGAAGRDEGEEEEGERYVIIVVCIVVFTVLVSVAVVVTLCVLRRLDQDKGKMKYTTAAACPEGAPSAGPMEGGDGEVGCGGGGRGGEGGGVMRIPAQERDYLQVSAVSSSKTNTVGGGFSESGFESHHQRYHRQISDGGSFSLASSQELMGFPQHHRSNADVRSSSQLQLPVTTAAVVATGRKTPLQVELTRRADDFHSTSSAETTTTGDSGHGSDDEGEQNDTPLSPTSGPHPHHHHHSHHHHLHHPHPPPRPLRLGVGGGGGGGSGGSGGASTPTPTSFSLQACSGSGRVGTGSPIPETSRSSGGISPRPCLVPGGQLRGSSHHRSFNHHHHHPPVPHQSHPHPPHQPSSVRFAPEVTSVDSRGRYVSTDSIRDDDDSDLNTTTSGSFSVPPDDLYGDYRQLDLSYGRGSTTPTTPTSTMREGSTRYLGGTSGGGGSYGGNMVV